MPNGKYDPSFRVKIPIYDGQVKCAVEDGTKNPVYLGSPEDLANVFPKGVVLNLVVSGNIYILAGGGFGVTWRLGAAQVFPPSRPRLTDFFEAVASPAGGGGGGGGAPVEEEEEDEEDSHSESAVGGTPAGDRPATPDDQPTSPVPVAAPGRRRRAAASST